MKEKNINFNEIDINTTYNFFKPLIEKLEEEILKIYAEEFKIIIKNDNTYLTKADLKSHDLIIEFINNNFPNDLVLSEEEEDFTEIPNKNVWIIDPIDGTKEFVNKTGEFAVMIGRINKNKKSDIGLIHIPTKKETIIGIKDKGCYLINNNKITKIQVSEKEKIKDLTLIRSRNNFKKENIEKMKNMGIEKYKLLGSIGIKFAEIAKGNYDLCFYKTSNLGIWDICAPEVILKEAGGIVCDLFGDEIEYDLINKKLKKGVVGFSSPKLKEEILNSILRIN
jgi:3'(2'), 5'-bisphosphate nucleotidase